MKTTLNVIFKLPYVLSLVACLLLCEFTQAQKIGQIKKKATENKQKKSSSNSSRSSTNDNSGGGGSNIGGAIIEGLFRAIFSGRYAHLSPEERAALRAEREAQRAELRQLRLYERAERQLARQEMRAAGKLNRLFEFNAAFQYGGIPALYQSYRPRFRLRYGAVSTDLRYTILTEERTDGRDSYETLDWQILQANLINTPHVTWRFGIGFMNERFTDSFFPEFLTGLDIYSRDRRIRFSPELRVAYDFHPDADVAPRTEVGGELSYAVINLEKFQMHLGLNGQYARYYEEVDVWTLGAGIRLNVY